MVLAYRGRVTIATTIAPLLHVSHPREILCASEADTLERLIGPRGRVMNDETPVNLYWFAIQPNKVFAVVSDQELGQEHVDAYVGGLTMIDGDLGLIEPF